MESVGKILAFLSSWLYTLMPTTNKHPTLITCVKDLNSDENPNISFNGASQIAVNQPPASVSTLVINPLLLLSAVTQVPLGENVRLLGRTPKLSCEMANSQVHN